MLGCDTFLPMVGYNCDATLGALTEIQQTNGITGEIFSSEQFMLNLLLTNMEKLVSIAPQLSGLSTLASILPVMVSSGNNDMALQMLDLMTVTTICPCSCGN